MMIVHYFQYNSKGDSIEELGGICHCMQCIIPYAWQFESYLLQFQSSSVNAAGKTAKDGPSAEAPVLT